MTNRTILLITILVVITTGLLYIALAKNQKPNEEKNVNVQTIKPTVKQVNKDSFLSLSPNLLTISSGSGSVDVLLSSEENKITAVQLELQYDPKVITITNISAGAFFQSPLELLKIIDVKNGRISYALASPPAKETNIGAGKVAAISFNVIPNSTATQTQITFLAKSLVTAETETESVLKSTQGTTIVINK